MQPDTWGRKDTRTSFIVNRGYTMHQHLGSFGLINMNGRVYDPAVGMFLSPDPYVQAPDNWLNYNRYSYCLNNPLMYTDPTGEFWHLIIGAVVGGLINWGMHGADLSWEGLAYFGVGALAGTVGAGVAGGVAATLAGSSFLAGFAGTQVAQTAISTGLTSCFQTGFLVGSSAGMANGITLGLGNGLFEGESFSDALNNGLKTGLLSGVSGGLTGGALGGMSALSSGRNFFNGDRAPISLPQPRAAGSMPSPMSPQAKGEAGVQRAMDEFKRGGGEVMRREVTIEVDGTRVRVDFIGEKNGQLYLYEVKNGPKAGFTPNQKIVYPKIQEGSQFIPRGENASHIQFKGFKVGVPYKGNFNFIIQHYFD